MRQLAHLGRPLAAAAALAAVLCLPGVAIAADGVDQNTAPSGASGSYHHTGTNWSWGQTFTAGRTGPLNSLSLVVARFDGYGGTDAFTITVRDTTATGMPGPTVLATKTLPRSAFPAPPTYPAVPAATRFVLDAPPQLTAGVRYAVVIRGAEYFAYLSAAPFYAAGQRCYMPDSTGPNCASYGDPDFMLRTYMPAVDSDGDGLVDDEDNCAATPNPTQTNADGDTLGDACDPDRDGDALANEGDNCADATNPGQEDADRDGLGDVCDPDRDGDTFANEGDNCPDTASADQSDADGDGMGDVCDADRDSDGVPNDGDNCPSASNADQADADGDTLGDVCDPDRDGDAVADASDNCAAAPNAGQADRDGDGVGDACDTEDGRAKAIGDTLAMVDGLAVQGGTQSSLGAKLRRALEAYNRDDDAGACNALTSFLHEVRAQAGKKLTEEQAADLTADATAIRTTLGC